VILFAGLVGHSSARCSRAVPSGSYATELTMPNTFADIAFTPAVKAAQQRDGSRASYARNFERAGAATNQRLGDDEAHFIARQRSFYMATVSETGWPYVQHRGGPRGFLEVLDDQTLAFADFAGNRQLISAGNAVNNDRVALILVDYAQRLRLKILGHLQIRDLAGDEALAHKLHRAEYKARPQRAMTIGVAGFDWNCPQHIPVRIDAEDMQQALDERDARIAALELQLKAKTAATAATSI
jgi:uncharacterized protein